MDKADPNRFLFLFEDLFERRSLLEANEHILQKRIWFMETFTDQF